MASKGFFDVYNTPAWDTWIALFDDARRPYNSRTYLVAWHPQSWWHSLKMAFT